MKGFLSQKKKKPGKTHTNPFSQPQITRSRSRPRCGPASRPGLVSTHTYHFQQIW